MTKAANYKSKQDDEDDDNELPEKEPFTPFGNIKHDERKTEQELPTNMGSAVALSSKDVVPISRDDMLNRVQMEFEAQDKKKGQKTPSKPPVVIETKYNSINMFPVNPNLGSDSIKQTTFRTITSDTPTNQVEIPKADDFTREMSTRFVNTLGNKRNTTEEATAALIRDVKK